MPEPPDRREDAVAVVRALCEAGHVAYFAGGCVRDELLGLVPKDYDVATDAHPDVVRDLFGRGRTDAVGASFGVILVREGASKIEVATFRTDLEYHDGRRPSGVVFTSAEQDARRRDFTINGLFLDPLVTEPGDDGIIDYVGGKADLAQRRLRAIGEPAQRFEEDYLRMLRAVRFAARFGLRIEAATWQAIVHQSPRLALIAPERVAEELRLMLLAETRGEAWRLLWESGLLAVVLRALPEKLPDAPERRPIIEHVSRQPGTISFGLALAATVMEARRAAGVPARVLLEPAEVKRAASALRKVLRWSNDEEAEFVGTLSLWQLVQQAEPHISRMKRFLAAPYSGDARVILEAMSHESALRPRFEWLRQRLAELETTDCAPPPLLTGDDLVEAGFTPGPAFKRTLDHVYDAQLEGQLQTKDQAMHLARELMSSDI